MKPALSCMLALALLTTGCSLVGGSRQPATIYAPSPVIRADPAWPTADWSLAIPRPLEARHLGSQRIAVSPVAGELQVYRGAQWARTPGEMVEDAVLRTLEASGKLPAVARQGSGIAADYRLLLEIRDFRADYAGSPLPAAVINVNAKLLRLDDLRIVASHDVRVAQPATGVELPQVNAAFAQALGTASQALAGWALAHGQADRHPPAQAAH